MQRIRLSQNVVLEITDDVISRPNNASPFMYLYEYGANSFNNKQIVLEDGQKEERTKSFWATEQNTLLSTTPNFYPDDKVSAGFHNAHRIDTLLGGTGGQMEYRKVRMLFAQGFAYSTGSNGVALTTLNIHAVRPSNNARIDLLSHYDIYDNSDIQPIPQVLYDNQLFNSAIELYIIDLAYLFNSTDANVIAIKNRLFGTDNIETLFIEHAGVTNTDITTFSEFAKTFKRFSDPLKTRQQFSPRFSNDEIICEVKKQTNGSVTMEMKHERFNLQGFLEKNSKVTELYYTIKADEYNSSNALIGSTIVRMTSPTNLFNKILYRIDNLNAATDHIQFNIEGFILQEDGTRISRSSSLIVTDVTPLKTLALTATLEEEKLVRSETKQVKQVVYKPDTPKIINIEKPVYVQTQTTLDKIVLSPFKQTIKITTNLDISLVRKIKLSIGDSSYFNIPTDKLTFTVGSEAFFSKGKTYYLLNENEEVISHGNIERVKI